MTTPPQPGIPKGPAAAEPGGLPAGTHPAHAHGVEETRAAAGSHCAARALLSSLACGCHPSAQAAFVIFSLHHSRPHGQAGAAP